MSTVNSKVLIVDDQPSIRRVLRTTLTGFGFEISEAARGEEALSLVRTSRFDVVVLDLNMPGIGGLETCKRIRQLSTKLPILVVTVSASTNDTVDALDAGADDYITKPFNLRELVARVRASIRRGQLPEEEQLQTGMSVGDIQLDPERRLLLKGGRPVHLTPKEFDLLLYLMSNADKPVTHERLLKSVWGVEYQGELEYLRTFVRQIRKKIEDDPSEPRYLLTHPYIGYRFCSEV